VINGKKILLLLKHTVNVTPMGNVTIEFYGSEYGIGFPLSYIIPYDGRYARVFSYDTQGIRV
jgi:hypothetical protein